MHLGGRSRLAAALVALLLSATGCGSEETREGAVGQKAESPSVSPSLSPSPSSSVSPSASPSASDSPTPPPVPAATDDEAGRRAFATWFVEAFAYAFATNDAVAATEERVQCSVCTAFAEFLQEREDKGVTLQPSSYVVRKIFPTAKVKDVHVYTMITKRPAYADVAEDGTRTDERPTDNAYPIEVGLRYRDGRYELTGWKAGKGS